MASSVELSDLYQVFDDRLFQIPDYQRGYAWEEKQWKDLIEDIEYLPEKQDHFFGTLVLRPIGEDLDGKGHPYQVVDIVDGQQRLTTVVILINVLRREMEDYPKEFKGLPNGLVSDFINIRDSNDQPIARLKLNTYCDEFFRDNILELFPSVSGDDILSIRLLRRAKSYFENYCKACKEHLGSNYPNWLNTTNEKITRHLKIIVYKVDDEIGAAGVIFEAMNDRGKDLTQLELVKNYLLYIASNLGLNEPSDLRDVIVESWGAVFRRLMEAGDDDDSYERELMRYHWAVVYSGNPRAVTNRTIKDYFDLKKYPLIRHKELLSELKKYLHTLKDAAECYRDILKPNRENAFEQYPIDTREKIARTSEKLLRLGYVAPFAPLLIAVRLKGDNKGETYLKTVELCEKLGFRVYSWARNRSNTAISQLYGLAHNYYMNTNSVVMLQDLVNLVEEKCPYNSLMEHFENWHDWYDWNGLDYFLFEYEQYLAGEKPIEMTWDVLRSKRKEQSIEHILPQTPTDPYWLKNFDDEQRKLWTNDIGNLTLTFFNGSLSNKKFPDKRGTQGQNNTYSGSPLFIERDIATYQDWTIDEIKNRRDRIKAWMLERWKIEMPAKPLIVQPPMQTQNLPPDAQKAATLKKYENEAIRLGNGPEFSQLFELCCKFHLYQYLNPQYSAPEFNLPTRHTSWMIWLGPDLYVSFNLDGFDHFFNLTAGTTAKIIGEEKRHLTREEVPDFADRLNRLLQAIQLKPTN